MSAGKNSRVDFLIVWAVVHAYRMKSENMYYNLKPVSWCSIYSTSVKIVRGKINMWCNTLNRPRPFLPWENF